MRTLPANVILQKNLMSSDAPFLMLLDIVLDEATLRLVRNTENITYGGNEYTAFPFEVDQAKESLKGEIESLQLKASNVNRILQAYVEEENGLIGASVTLRVVHAEYLSEVALELTYTVMSSYSDANWVYLGLGMPSPLRKRFPKLRYLAYCNWVGTFPGIGQECNYTGSDTSCKGTFEDCHAKGNTARFGGQMGLRNPSVRAI